MVREQQEEAYRSNAGWSPATAEKFSQIPKPTISGLQDGGSSPSGRTFQSLFILLDTTNWWWIRLGDLMDIFVRQFVVCSHPSRPDDKDITKFDFRSLLFQNLLHPRQLDGMCLHTLKFIGFMI